ncbi:MAG TPA: DNA-3-methyladenine glycosylase I [Anaerolineales bacterium]|nr:DNA-3-methyladenine glycosylase I [Anaerolineales bacterium]
MPGKRAPAQIKATSLNDYLEIMSKAVFQSGISWKVVENKWPGIREAFDNFDVQQVADYDERDFQRLSQDRRVIRNYRKLVAIAHNARKILELNEEHGSFQKYIRSHGNFENTIKALQSEFKFLGPFGTYYFLYIVGEKVPSHEAFREKYGKN